VVAGTIRLEGDPAAATVVDDISETHNTWRHPGTHTAASSALVRGVADALTPCTEVS
jgi:hypothetical protein